MSHPPERLLAELARILSRIDPEAAVHVEFCPACGVRFAAVLSLLGDAADRQCRRPALATCQPRRGLAPSLSTRAIHPAEGSLVGFARALVEINEKVFEHVQFCTSCLWQVVQALPDRPARQASPYSAVLAGCAWAEVAEARRRQEDLAGAEQAIDGAALCETDSEAAGERWFLQGEIRRDQGRSTEALALYKQACTCFDSCGAVERQAVATMRAAVLSFAERRPAEAIALFEGACSLVSRGVPARLALLAAQGKIVGLARAGRYPEAASAGKIAVLCLADAVGCPPGPSREGWTAAFANGAMPYRERLWDLLAESITRSCPWEAALLGLDFAAILADDGSGAELARLADQVRPLAMPGGLPCRGRNLLAPVLRAAAQGSVKVDQIRHAADAIALCWTEPELALGV